MQTVSQNFLSAIEAPSRELKAQVKMGGYTLEAGDGIVEIKIERTGEHGKFFGILICQKLTLKFINKGVVLPSDLPSISAIEVSIGLKDISDWCSFPTFYVDGGFKFDETSNTYTVEAYDKIYTMSSMGVQDFDGNGAFDETCFYRYFVGNPNDSSIAPLVAPTINNVFSWFNTYGGITINVEQPSQQQAQLVNLYSENYSIPNISIGNNLRDVLTDALEVVGAIGYMAAGDILVVKTLNPSASGITTGKNVYRKFTFGEAKTLAYIKSTNGLGDDIDYVSDGDGGALQSIVDNIFLDNDNNRVSHLETLADGLHGLTNCEFTLEWKGNPAIELGDRLSVTTDGGTVNIYMLDDTLTFNGGLKQTTQWAYDNNVDTSNKAATNKTTIGEVLKDTYARVDKVARKIEIVAAENANNYAQIEITTNQIMSTVEQTQAKYDDDKAAIDGEIASITEKVSQTVSAEQMDIAINKKFQEGAKTVETETGFTFNDEGLTVSKNTSDMTTTITENGMTVFKNEEVTLRANNEGVEAVNLNASTYLIVGGRSRFENYLTDRTGCFWIGGE